MGPEDAAALLLALLSGEGGSRTIPTLQRLWVLKPDPKAAPTRGVEFKQDWLPDPVIEPAAETLGEVLTSLFATAAAGQLRERLARASSKPGLFVSHFARSFEVDVSIFSDDPDAPAGDFVRFGEEQKPDIGGMAEIRHVHLDVFEAVGAALADRNAEA